jgi:hypothetical protein
VDTSNNNNRRTERVGPVTNFVVVTDHAALTHTQDAKERSSRVARWQVYLQNYGFSVEHRRGRDNLGADALSRPAYLLPVKRFNSGRVIFFICSLADTREAQVKNRVLQGYTPFLEDQGLSGTPSDCRTWRTLLY